MSDRAARRARVLAVSEAQIPSAVLGVNAVFEHLDRACGLCELRVASSIDLAAGDLVWADSVVLVRGASPGERRILAEAQRLGRFVATYMDDDLERVPAEARSGYFFTSPVVRANVAAIVRAADAVLVTSERLGDELARRHGRTVTLVRQPRPRDGSLPPQPRGDGRLRVGFLGSVDHASFLTSLLQQPLTRLKRERGDAIELVFCGAVPEFARELGALCQPFEPDFTAWRRAARSLDLTIGLAPLPDTPFHRCKYWNKYLEYASLDVAGIYSAVPPYADAVRAGETGLLIQNSSDAWRAAIDELIDRPERRAAIVGAAARDAEERFSEVALEGQWRAALAPLLAHRAPPSVESAAHLPRGRVRWALDRMAVYGPARLAERALGRLSGRLRPG